jgi:ribosomal-protein-alanine N-acetyltransferase
MSAGLVVRAATPADIEAIVAIERASFSDPWSRGLFADAVAVARMRFEVAEAADGAVAGYIISAFVADLGEILNLAVAPAHRRSGIGSVLLGRAIAAAGEAGVASLHLEVRESNEAARSLYGRFGFRGVGRRRAYYRNPPEDALVLRLDVGAPAA